MNPEQEKPVDVLQGALSLEELVGPVEGDSPRVEHFQNKGGIERIFGKRNKQAVIDTMNYQGPTIPEDPVKSERALKYKPLVKTDPTIRVIRPIGHLFISSDVHSSDGSGQRLERWSEYKSITNAIRGISDNIILPYGKGGEERELRRRAAKLAARNIMRLQEGKITEEEMEKMNGETALELIEIRFKNSLIPERREAAELLAASTEPDSRGEINPPKSRMQANAARVRIIGEQVRDDVVLTKAERRVIKLLAYKDYVDGVFDQIAAMSEIALKAKIGTGAFDLEEYRFRKSIIDLLSPERGLVVVQPYLTSATIARHSLLAKGEPGDINKVGKLAGYGVATRICKDSVPYHLLTDPEDRKARIREVKELLLATVERSRSEVSGPQQKEERVPRKTQSDEFWERVSEL